MPKTLAKPKKQVKKSAGVAEATHEPRLLQLPKRVWYKPLTWRHRPPVPAYKRLPKARILFWNTLKQLWVYRGLFGGIIVIYGLLNVLLVKGLSGSGSVVAIKNSLDALSQGHGAAVEVGNSLGTYVALLASSGSGNTQTSGVYQTLLLIVCSLAFIWAFRQMIAKNKVRVRDSFYQGMYPLIPFVLTFMLLGLQLLPLAIGSQLYSLTASTGIAAHEWERIIAFAIFVGLGLWSLRMITATIFALYIVTLPDMTPLRAYRSARQLVYGRRLLLWRKLIFLPVALLVVSTALELPLILFATPLAAWMFFVISMVALPVVHGYLYNLYREML